MTARKPPNKVAAAIQIGRQLVTLREITRDLYGRDAISTNCYSQNEQDLVHLRNELGSQFAAAVRDALQSDCSLQNSPARPRKAATKPRRVIRKRPVK